LLLEVCGVGDLVEEYEKSGNRATEGQVDYFYSQMIKIISLIIKQ